MKQRFLLYIDLLGFSDLVNRSGKVRSLYRILDSLSAHRHHYFTTIVFSDTILVYNKDEPEDDEERNYIVWYAIEFAEDLHHKLRGTGVFFRGMLTYGEFEHYELKNTECFFGRGLVHAYNSEKQLPAVGLFIDDKCQEHNEYFPTARFNEKWSFVYLNRSLERLHEISTGILPIDPIHMDMTEEFPFILWELDFLREVRHQMQDHRDPRVRAKHLATWDLYHQRYTGILNVLASHGFEPEPICPTGDWEYRKQLFRESLEETKSRFGGHADE